MNHSLISPVRWWQGLSFRVLIVVALVLGFGFGASWLIAIKLTKDAFYSLTHERFHERFDDINTQIHFLSEVSLLWANNMAAQLDSQQFEQSGHFQDLFEHIQKTTRADVAMLVEPNGHLLSSSHGFLSGQEDLSTWSIVQSAVSNQQDSSFITTQYNRFFLFSASPVFDKQRRIKGVFILGYGLNDQFLLNMQGTRHSELALVRRRAIMASTFSPKVKELPLNYLEYQQLLSDQLTFKTLKYGKQSYLIDGASLPLMAKGVPGSVLLAVPMTALSTQLQDIHQQFASLFLGSFLVLGVLIGGFLRIKLRPIQMLIQATEQVSHGDLAVTVESNNNDELGKLAGHFNQMTARLAQANLNLARYHQGLEQTIKERTEDLAASNLRLELSNIHLEEAQAIATMGHWIFTPSTQQLKISASLASLLGLPPKEQTLTKSNFLSMVDPREQELAASLFHPVNPDDAAEGTFLLYPIGQNPVYLRCQSRSIQGEEGQVLGSVLDITSIKLKEKELTLAREEAEGANRLKDKLLSLLVHDLKGPISSVMGTLDILLEELEDQLNDQNRELLTLSHGALEGLIAMIHGLLELQQIKQGQLHLNCDWTNLNQTLEQLRSQLSGLLASKQLTLENQLPNLSCHWVDPKYITEVLQNLITNAIKFSHPGGTIQVMTGGNPLEISVVDHGVGMSQQQTQTIFEMGANVSTFGTKGEKGSGLGMPLCAEIMKAHGGEILIVSQPDQGSQFTLTFK